MVICILVNGIIPGLCYNVSKSIYIFCGFFWEILTKFYILRRKWGVRTGIPNRCMLSVRWLILQSYLIWDLLAHHYMEKWAIGARANHRTTWLGFCEFSMEVDFSDGRVSYTPLRIQTICPYMLHGNPNPMGLVVLSIYFNLNPYG